ncbi:MAG: putative rane protein, partial [Acidimicrobiales bacterium]|nr:putative rane protein [Acidimicrobiales bacterium]
GGQPPQQWPPPGGQPPQQWGPPPQQWGPPPQQWGPPPGYPTGYGSPPSYGYGPQTENLAVIALILAIASFVVCPVIPAIVALVLGSNAKKKIAMSGGALTGDGLVTAATIVAWVNIGLAALAIVGIVLLAVLGSTTDSSSVGTSMGLLLR